jgi:hypothetical protein
MAGARNVNGATNAAMIFAMRPRAILTLLGTAAALLATPQLAFATPNGSDSGCSGKTGIPNDVCTSCGNCHQGGPLPSVAFTGPATLNSGATATYTFTVSTSLKETGCDIAATTGVAIAPVGGNLQNSFGELTQPSPQPLVSGTTTYQFTVVGPEYGGTIELWGSGVGADGNGGTGGDGATNTTMMITVNGPPNPGGGGAVGASDAGASLDAAGPTGGFLPDGSAVDVDPPGVDLPDASGNGLAPDDVLHQDSGCSIVATNGDGTNVSGTGILAAGVVMAGLFMSRKKRR